MGVMPLVIKVVVVLAIIQKELKRIMIIIIRIMTVGRINIEEVEAADLHEEVMVVIREVVVMVDMVDHLGEVITTAVEIEEDSSMVVVEEKKEKKEVEVVDG